MANIERWWTITVCRDCGQRVHADNTGHATYCRAPDVLNVEAVEVVPASRLAGAVEALRRYARHDDGCPLHEAGDDSPQPCECGLSDALDRFGGQ